MTDSPVPTNLIALAAQLNDAELDEVLRIAVKPELIDSLLLTMRADQAIRLKNAGDLEGAFAHFHYCITGKEISPYVKYIWLPKFIWAYKNNRGVLLECHRSAGKSFFMVVWVLFLIWIRPVGSIQYIRISDAVAKETDRAISMIVELNSGWKLLAQDIVPDTDRGWSSDGRNFKDKSIEPGEWSRLTMADHGTEPSFLCAGIESGSIIGKHPSNGQWFDDLHDEGNTRSAAEMQKVVDVFEKNIVHTWTRPGAKKPTVGCACTFWSERDVYQAMLRTGMFTHIKTPIFVPDDDRTITIDGEKTPVVWLKDAVAEQDEYGNMVVPLWREGGYSIEDIRNLQKRQPVYFPMMYRCDLSAAKGKVLKREWLIEYPREQISTNWPAYFGIDFASTEDKLHERERDYFAMSIWLAVPGGGIVLVDGVRDHLGSEEALDKVQAVASMYPNLKMIGVEKWGKGEIFKNNMVYRTSLPIMPLPIRGTPVRSKGQRFQNGLAPLFTTGRAYISSVHTPFIDAFIDEWISWDGQRTATGHDDCLDGGYWGAVAASGHLMKSTEDDSPQDERQNFARRNRNPVITMMRGLG